MLHIIWIDHASIWEWHLICGDNHMFYLINHTYDQTNFTRSPQSWLTDMAIDSHSLGVRRVADPFLPFQYPSRKSETNWLKRGILTYCWLKYIPSKALPMWAVMWRSKGRWRNGNGGSKSATCMKKRREKALASRGTCACYSRSHAATRAAEVAGTCRPYLRTHGNIRTIFKLWCYRQKSQLTQSQNRFL